MVNRKFLYWGVFLVAAGGVLLVAQTAAGSQAVEAMLRLWPLLVIGLGVGLLLRHNRVARISLAGGVLAAAMPGLVLGGLVAETPDVSDWSMDCRITEPADYERREGTFAGGASVDVKLDCGDVTITAIPGRGWTIATGTADGKPAHVEVSEDRLSIESTDRPHRFGEWGGDSYRVSIPQDVLVDLSATVNAGRGVYDLAGGRYGDLRLDVNAGDARVDLTGATLNRLVMGLNAAKATVQLPAAGDFEAAFDANAAALVICAPDGLGLRIREEVTLGSSTFNGLVRIGNAWESPDYSSATSHADVTVSVNVGSVDVNPVGGCK